MLEPTELRLYTSETEIIRYAQSEGYMQVANNHVLLLVEEVHDARISFDVAQLRERLSQAESDLESAGDDTERRRVAEREQASVGRRSSGWPKAGHSQGA